MTLHAVWKWLPEDPSGLQINPDHLLSTISVGALSRADGWQAGAEQIDDTLADFEAAMAA